MSEPERGARNPAGARRRTAARLAAVQALYQIELAGAPAETVVTEFLRHRLGRQREDETFGEADATLFAELVRGAVERQAELDRLIGAALSPDWPLLRLESVLRAILRLGAYELLACSEVPATVAISEYLDIAHAFFAAKEPGLVNGVLDHLARTLRPNELGERHRGGAVAPQ
ncbi:MAG TPA: transcription antitermination factor NusB [Stellaceae bacterium]|nr:transcription antitermination factor NusB [Stellaceae bacterium]